MAKQVGLVTITGSSENPINGSNPLPVKATDITTMTPSNSSVSVSTVSTLVLATNSERRYAVITNISTGSLMYFSVGKNAKVGQGIPLWPKSSLEIFGDNLTTRAIKAINASTSTKLASFSEY